MTQLESARRGDVSQQVKRVAGREGLDPESVRQAVAKGTVVVPANAKHTRLDPCGIGEGLRTKVNANIGTSSVSGDVDTELRKLRICEEFGADAVTWYEPGFRSVKMYEPSAFAWVSRLMPVATSTAFTVAFATAAPEESVMIPVILP